jgi:energy-coupling factor transport system ATP-binding protein
MTFVLPLSIALLIVWGVIVGAPPGATLGSDPHSGYYYAMTVALRIAVLGGVFQLTILTIPSEQLAYTLRTWGLRGGLLVVVLGAFALIPELAHRADQVLTARQARGLVADRSLVSRFRQFPYLLRPLLAWALRSAVQRSEFWQQRQVLSRVENSSHRTQNASTASYDLASHFSMPLTWANDLDVAPGEIVRLSGPNFSGRTRILRAFTGLSDDPVEGSRPVEAPHPMAYIGPEVYNVLSGLSQTVRGELSLYFGGAFNATPLEEAAGRFGLDRLYDRSPFDLSGGEQTCLALLSALALRPRTLGLDCAFEQLDPGLRAAALQLLQNATNTATAIAHNRSSETGNARDLDITHMPAASRWPTPNVFGTINPEEMTVRPPLPVALRMEDVRFGYTKATDVVRGMSLDLAPGQLYYLSGNNGAGKSTVAKILTGVLRPSHGQMFVGDARFQPWRNPGRVVAYHFQNPDLQMFSTSVEDEVYAGPRAARHSEVDCSQLAESMIRTFGLDALRREHPLDLPFVVRKRIALAASLAVGTPWVVLDEPTLGQDESSSIAIATIIQKLLSVGTGVVVITHSDWFRELIAGDLLWLRDGVLATAAASQSAIDLGATACSAVDHSEALGYG